jgi:hypothetical protein
MTRSKGFKKPNVEAPSGPVGFQVAEGKLALLVQAASEFEDVPERGTLWVTITAKAANNRVETIAKRLATCFGGSNAEWTTALTSVGGTGIQAANTQRTVGFTLLYVAYECARGAPPETFPKELLVETVTAADPKAGSESALSLDERIAVAEAAGEFGAALALMKEKMAAASGGGGAAKPTLSVRIAAAEAAVQTAASTGNVAKIGAAVGALNVLTEQRDKAPPVGGFSPPPPQQELSLDEQIKKAVEGGDVSTVLTLTTLRHTLKGSAGKKRTLSNSDGMASALAGLTEELREMKRARTEGAAIIDTTPKISGAARSVDALLADGGVSAEFEQTIRNGKYLSFAKLAPTLLGNRGAATAIDEEASSLAETELPFAVWDVAARAWEDSMARFHPGQAEGVKEYLSYIRRLSRLFMGDNPRGYLQYDAQFRAHAARLTAQGHPVQWATPSTQLQMSIFAGCRTTTCFMCGASDHDTNGHSKATLGKGGSGGSGARAGGNGNGNGNSGGGGGGAAQKLKKSGKKGKDNACFDWNNGKCSRKDCRFKHHCRVCAKAHVFTDKACPEFNQAAVDALKRP